MDVVDYLLATADEPDQPGQSEWRFVEDLQSPLWPGHRWTRRDPREGEASLTAGVRIDAGFDDPDDLLATAYADLRAFLHAGRIASDSGSGYRIQTRRIDTAIPESYRIDVAEDQCTLVAGDTEGVRRGLYYLEDLMLRADGPFLPLGVVEREPVIRTRISRCFFGPINRPPANRDELADDVNYYPDEYLNRLAHDGVNGLWLTIKFRDLCRSRFFPRFGLDSARRLKKLRQTVKQCARYGIKIYPFCIEPAGFGEAEYLTDKSMVEHPELLGHSSPAHTNFCTSSEIGQQYLEEATFTLFDAVPGLGGLIAIQLGERPTHCCSAMHQLFENNCPRCSKRRPGEVFADTWSAMARGMHRADPSAELISWLYTPYVKDTPDSTAAQKVEMLRDIAGHVPPDITLQLNFESSGQAEQCGREHPVDDYSLSYIGPSELFAQCAEEVRRRGGRMAGKLQVGNSHEVATVPYVPVPGNLYQKYAALHRLGASTVMQCWYFGNYPSLMTQAAGELSFAPFPPSQEAFLLELARIRWGSEAPLAAQAWRHFQNAYARFPVNLNFSWFGPVHDSASWPLHLKPVNRPIAPSWKLGFPPSGDRVGECIGYEHTLQECVDLCRDMTQTWAQGVAVLQDLVQRTGRGGEDELSVATALGLQLQSTFHVMTFYALREALPQQRQTEQVQTLEQMRGLVQAEIGISRRLAELASEDSRLGFHSEAEGYKYFPEKLAWRVSLLEEMLQDEFSEVASAIARGEPLFPEYTGAAPAGAQYACRRLDAEMHDPGDDGCWKDVPKELCRAASDGSTDGAPDAWRTNWQAVEDGQTLYLKISCESPGTPTFAARNDLFLHGEHLAVHIESRRLGPSHVFRVDPSGQTVYQGRRSGPAAPWRAWVRRREQGEWSAVLAIPFACLDAGEKPVRPLRLNIKQVIPSHGVRSWVPLQAAPFRLIFADDNPANYGWLMTNQQKSIVSTE